ncbi:hypothetical protein [Streptomyces sp. MJP52]|uniref:hypothetical protein n=1 Tax=Streptomyces sp. MJP52 TaxID=2940555 RepID=UPI0024750665|nr:hypothetical protein [Streptomyces sp. MJP52]MDH6224905.1 hypothetical protein [Streptomyces sp. MJP52]
MSYSLSVYKFANGGPVPPDPAVVRQILAPHVVAPERAVQEEGGEFWIRAADGSEVEIDVSDVVIGVHRPQVGDVWEIIMELADKAGGVVLVPNGILLCRDDVRPHLPEGMAKDARFVPRITLAAFEEVAGPFDHPLT